MRTRPRWWFLSALLLASGCDGQADVDRLARIGRKIVGRVTLPGGETSGSGSAPLQAIRGNWNLLTLDARVTFRLRWEKELENAAIEVRSAGSGVVELRGTIGSGAQRQRAVALAKSTVGVAQVVDRLAEAKSGP